MRKKGLSVKCTKCGQEKSASRAVYQKRVAKFGSEENMKANYVCRNCRKALGIPVVGVKASKKVDQPSKKDIDPKESVALEVTPRNLLEDPSAVIIEAKDAVVGKTYLSKTGIKIQISSIAETEVEAVSLSTKNTIKLLPDYKLVELV